MNITESNLGDINLICFERQKLECPGCGDRDSRFIFVPERASSPGEIPPTSSAVEAQWLSSDAQVAEQILETRPDPTNSDEQPTLAPNGAEQPPPQIKMAEPQPAQPPPVDPGFEESQSLEFADLKSFETRAVKPRDVSKTLSDLIQGYLAKWHRS
jgi:hypothetical protein